MERKKKLKIILGVLGGIVILGLLYVILAIVDGRMDIFEGDDDYEYDDELSEFDGIVRLNGHTYKLQHDVQTFLIMGTDATGNEDAVGDEYQGSMADFLLLAVVDEEAKQYGFIQLDRDTITEVPLLQKDDTAFASADEQLCIAHWYGKDKKASCTNAARTVSALIGGMPINGYYAMKMDAMPVLNQAVGGVEVTIEDDFSKADPSLIMGKTIKLTDEQAYSYLRSRMNVGDGNNEGRMRRQRTYMNAVMEKIRNEAKNSAEFVAKVYNDMQEYATSSISGKTVNKMSKLVGSMKEVGLFTPEGESKIGNILDDGEPHAEFYMDEASLEEIMLKLYPLEQCEEEESEEAADDEEDDDEDDEEDEEDGEDSE